MRRILSVLILLAFLNLLPMSAMASSYTKGFNEGKKAGFEEGREAGYSAGYRDRGMEAQVELNSAIINTAAIVIAVSVLVFIPSTVGITAYFVNRKRDKIDYK